MNRPFGPTGASLPPIGLGGMPLSVAGRPGDAVAERVITTALDAGIRLIDTADVYCLDHTELGHNERRIAEAIRQWGGRDTVRVATKGGCTRPDGRWGVDGRPARLEAACVASLRALGTEQIWLYQLHAPDPKVAFADQIGALARLRESGKIAHIGLSNITADQLRAAHAITPVASVQQRLSPHHTRPFTDGLHDACAAIGAALIAYSPVGGRNKARTAHDPTLLAVGRPLGMTPFQVALRWLVQRSPLVFPIPGASKLASARSSAAALRQALPPAAMAELNAAFLPERP
jgi:aryl-alcohol dehydrogenase-like predicted oxidoreductase